MTTEDKKKSELKPLPIPGRSVSRIILCSTSDVKLEAVKKSLNETKFLKDKEILTLNTDSNKNPPQPINSGIQCAKNRISTLQTPFNQIFCNNL